MSRDTSSHTIPTGRPVSRAPSHIGSYEIIGTLGQGAMGIVYHAYDSALCKDLAIKVMRQPCYASEELDLRFAAEVAAVNQIGHPNIVNIFGYHRLEDGRPYYVMEFLRGSSMQELLEVEASIDPARLVDWMRSVADAIGAGHNKRIIHRDLKPDNIFLAETGRDRHMVKVLDFGVAKLLEGPKMTLTGMRIGTPLFMSPEQFVGETSDHRTDIYAFGAIYYRALTGRSHIRGTTIGELGAFHRQSMLPKPPSCYGAPAALDAPILRCLSPDRDERFASIEAAQRAIESAFNTATTAPCAARRAPIGQAMPAAQVRDIRAIERIAPALRFSRVDHYRFSRSNKPLIGALVGIAAFVLLMVGILMPSSPTSNAPASEQPTSKEPIAARSAKSAPKVEGLTVEGNVPDELRTKQVDPAIIQSTLLSNGQLARCIGMADGRELPQLLGVKFGEDGKPRMRMRGGDPVLRKCIQKAFSEMTDTILATAS